MLHSQDLTFIASLGISQEQVEHQLRQIAQGFPYLRLKSPAAIGNGIIAPDDAQRQAYIHQWQAYLAQGTHRVTKFVPASGAASRMFKNLFSFLSADYAEPTTAFEKEFFENIHRFAFYHALDAACLAGTGKTIDELIAHSDYKPIVDYLLTDKGLNYGSLPKGLLLFHSYDADARTPMEEHLVEAAQYAVVNGTADIHFTVSHSHLSLFQALVTAKAAQYEELYNIKYHISFSEQKASTDTIATNLDNTPFHNADGTLLFRPGGHGALIANLNDIASDIVFIKNIDNVVPDKLKDSTKEYKQLLAGILVAMQDKAFTYLRTLDSGQYNHDKLIEMITFLQHDLCCRKEDIKHLEDAELVIYLREKLNRPMRVCGMVKNVGEPGGGPFIAYNSDGTYSPQILESSQIDTNNEEYNKMFHEGTHFNPVDLVCAINNYQGEPFDLTQYVDHNTGFISQKSKDGRELKALELPGLWNGAMSNWNTIFVEVPLDTFNPVKTVNDLLRPAHQ